MDVAIQIKDLIRKNMAVFEDNIEINDDDNIFELGFVNSIFAMKIVDFIETQYDIEVSDDDLDIKNFSSVSKIVSYVSRKQAQPEGVAG